MKKSQQGSTTLVGLVFLVVWLAAIGGWIANVYKLIAYLMAAGSEQLVITGMLVARGIGVVLAPLGCVLGYF